MCIIVAKKRGVNPPSDEVLKRCFKHNPDGAGFMYTAPGGEVFIRKGFMKDTEFMDAFHSTKFTKDDLAIFHFRIHTAGGKNAKTTHPFPVSRKLIDLEDTAIETDMGVVHNGTISNFCNDNTLSDTQVLAKKVLAKKNIRKGILDSNSKVFKKIENIIGSSKLALMYNNKIELFGSPWFRQDGLLFSNQSYQERKSIKCIGFNRSFPSPYGRMQLEKAFLHRVVTLFMIKFRGPDTKFNMIETIKDVYKEVCGEFNISFLGEKTIKENISQAIMGEYTYNNKDWGFYE